MKKIRIGQIGIEHDHAAMAFDSLCRQSDIFEVVGYAVEEPAAGEIKNPAVKGIPACYDGYRRYSVEELLSLDFGIKHGDKFAGLKIPTFEEILQKFAGRVIMNIHVKIWDKNFDDLMIEEIVELVRRYDCEKHIYFMTMNDAVIKKVMEYAPDLKMCVGWDGNKDPMSIVDRAIELGAYKLQLFKPYFNQETVDKAHAHGIFCNVFWADDPIEAREYLDMGIDTILKNDYLAIYNAVKDKL